MNKPHAGFWMATLGLGMSWLLVLLTHDHLNGVLLAGSVLALFFTPAARRKGALLTAMSGIGMDCLWSYSSVLYYSDHVRLALWIRFGCWWYWLLKVIRVTPWPLAVSSAIVGPFTYALCWKLEILQSDVPPEIML